MKTLKIYTQHKPIKLAGHYPTISELYPVSSQGVEITKIWFAEIETFDYFNTRLELEKLGLTAHPANSREFDSREFTIFRETAR